MLIVPLSFEFGSQNAEKLSKNEKFHDFLISLSAVQIRSTTKVVHNPQLYPIINIFCFAYGKELVTNQSFKKSRRVR